MIFVVDAIGRRACGRFCQRTAPVLSSTRIAERAVTAGAPWCGGRGVDSSLGGAGGGAGGSAGSAERGQSVAVADAGQGNAQRAGYVDTIPAFKSIDEAQAALTRAEREYRQAVSFLAARDTTTRTFRNSDVYRARLQALDAMAGVAREAVDEVPHDPVLSQYYLSTLAAREATLQQLTTTLPTGVRLTRF
jgi:hypothetical protein